MLHSPLSLSLLALSARSVSAAFADYTLNIVNARISPDGFARDASLVNGVFPGTVIFANKGDVIRNTVVNKLTNPTMRRSTTIVSRTRALYYCSTKNVFNSIGMACFNVQPPTKTDPRL